MTPKEEIETARLAFQFMMRFPIPEGADFDAARMAQSVRYYPMVGAVVGAVAALAYVLCAALVSVPFAPVAAIVTAMFATGALHEDGLADLVDGFWGGHTRERRLEIMRDSAIGSYGTLALILIVLAQYVLLSDLSIAAAMVALIVGHGLSRAGVVGLMQMGTYVRKSGAGENLTQRMDDDGRLVFAVQVLGLLLLGLITFGVLPMVGSVGIMALVYWGLSTLSDHKIGGYTGDVLGALQQLSYVGFYLGLGVLV